jgi:hypothetical protein
MWLTKKKQKQKKVRKKWSVEKKRRKRKKRRSKQRKDENLNFLLSWLVRSEEYVCSVVAVRQEKKDGERDLSGCWMAWLKKKKKTRKRSRQRQRQEKKTWRLLLKEKKGIQ